MSYEGADHAPYDVIDSVFPEQDSQQPPKDLVLNVCIFFSISASWDQVLHSQSKDGIYKRLL